MSKRIILLIATLAIATIFAGCTAQNGDDDLTVIRIVDGTADGFDPSNVTITAGTTVRWINQDNQAHTTTSDDDGETWDSGALSPGDDFEFTFEEPGEYPYHCELHAPQVGTIIVTEAEDA